MRILVTNDDGIDAPGLLELARAVYSAGHEVIVAAPHKEASGSSCSLSSVQEDGRTVIERRSWSELGDVEVMSVVASPAFISLLALRRAFGEPPEIVVSGINEGPNTGRAVIHSGTVGAALTAATYGARGLAVSMELGAPYHWDTARRLVTTVLRTLEEAPLGTTLNLNVPNRAWTDVPGLRSARLAPFGTVQTQIADSGDGFVKIAYTEPTEQAPPDSDAALLEEGFATITELQPTSEVSVDARSDLALSGAPFDRVM
jgi:5'-nucleotidase